MEITEKAETRQKEIWVEKNRIYLGKDNVLNFINVGEMTENIATECCDAMLKLVSDQEKEVDFLIDLGKGGKLSPAARKILKEFTKKHVHGKLAFCGLHPVARVLASFFMGPAKKKEMRFFKTKGEAEMWIKD
jgi:hypothetical protein